MDTIDGVKCHEAEEDDDQAPARSASTMEDIIATDKMRRDWTEQQPQGHPGSSIDGMITTDGVKGPESGRQSEDHDMSKMGTEEVKGKQAEAYDASVMEFTSEAQLEQLEVEVGGERNGKGKERLVEDESTITGAGGEQPGISGAQVNELWQELHPELDHQNQAANQDATSGPSIVMAPPPVPLPQDPGSDNVSLITSSVSNPTLEVDIHPDDDELDDADSAITDLTQQNSTNSLRSSIYDYVEENGRTFHRYKEGKYVLPNDEIEQNRLDMQHHMLTILIDYKLHLAPIKPDLQYVLDVGTGTGIWAIEFAQKYPSALVIGTDLSPIQPTFVPPNCQFEIDDAEDDWMFTKPFDFVHMRGMMTCFREPRDILQKSFDALAPGGYLEMLDSIFPMHCHDDTLEGTALDIWGKACVEAGKRVGREWTNSQYYRGWMEEIGFEDVTEKKFEIATSPWPKGRKQKELAMWWQADLTDAVGGSITHLIKGLGWEYAEIERLLVDVRKDIKNRGVHGFMPVFSVWGRKPKELEAAAAI